MRFPYFGVVFRNVICLCVVALICCQSRVLVAQSDVNQSSFYAASNGMFVANDSLVSSYFMAYARGGQYRKGIVATPGFQEAIPMFVDIPVLVSAEYSDVESFDLFSRAIKFNLSGVDEASGYSSQTGRGNIYFPDHVQEFLKAPDAYKVLFQSQLQLGNVLFVEHQSNFPYFIPNEGANNLQEVIKYRGVVVDWAAAYPWLFYGLKNVALKESLVSPKEVTALELFATNRFKIDQTMVDYINSMIYNPGN